jgi:hypothetical protein
MTGITVILLLLYGCETWEGQRLTAREEKNLLGHKREKVNCRLRIYMLISFIL